MPTIDRVEVLIREFATQLQSLLREQLSEEVTTAVQAALGGHVRPAKAGKIARPKGAKRTPEEIEKLAAKLLAYIGKNPDQRAEQLARAHSVTTGELVLPIKRLLDDKKIKASGKARGTTYALAK
jgi:hypothetical protein